VYVNGAIDADGTAAGQAGGAIAISAQRIVITGSVSANGADGPVGGDGAAVTLAARDLIFLGGAVRLHGGAGTTAGGHGGVLTIEPVSILGALTVAPGAVVSLDGGASGGTGVAGGGGHVFLTTSDGDLTMAGKLSLRGGDAPDAGGTGGLGGAADIFSDANF